MTNVRVRSVGLCFIASLLFLPFSALGVELVPIPPSEGVAAQDLEPQQYETGNSEYIPDNPGPDQFIPPEPTTPQALPSPPVRAQTHSVPVASAPAKPLRAGEMLFNFQDADIQAIVKTISQITGRNFLLDPRVKGRITIISAKPVKKSAAYEIFISALKAQGFTAVEGPGGIVKIIPEAEAKQSADVSSGSGQRRSDQWVSHVVEVQYASAPQLVPLLRPLMSPSALLSVYAPGNILVITDTAATVRNVLRIIQRVDQQGTAEISIIPLVHASVVDVGQLVSRFAEGAQIGGMSGQPPQAPGGFGGDNRLIIVPDLRTNSLLVRADNPGRVEELRSLVAKLDVPARAGGQTHVIYLRNAEAAKLVEVLRGLMAGEARASASSAAAPAAAGGPAPKTAEASLVQADEASNALIISAPDAIYNNLRAVIEKLDMRRAQVYVEALIVEVTSRRATQFGIQWAGGTGAGQGAVAAVTNFPSGPGNPGIIDVVASQGNSLGTAAGLTIGFIGREITLPDGSTVRGLGALARALESEVDANILSTPNLVTLDNAEAKIVVGQNVPFLTGSFAQAAGSSGSSVNPFQTIERKDVGITLKIKPQISEGGGVKLEIFQEVSSVVPSTDPLVQSTNKRTLETTVIVDDSNTMVLGGLIEDRVNENYQRVPLLGSIPIIGELFKFRDRSKSKTNLMIFLRPVIVRGYQDSFGFTTDRYKQIRAFQPDLTSNQKNLMERFNPENYKPIKQDADSVSKKAPAKKDEPANTAAAAEADKDKKDASLQSAPAPGPSPAPAPTAPAPQADSEPPLLGPPPAPVNP